MPAGLEEYLKLEGAETNQKWYVIIQKLETTLQRLVIDTLKH